MRQKDSNSSVAFSVNANVKTKEDIFRPLQNIPADQRWPYKLKVFILHQHRPQTNFCRKQGNIIPLYPLRLNNQMTQIIKSSIAATNRPHVVRVGLIVVVHEAIVQVHEPGVVW